MGKPPRSCARARQRPRRSLLRRFSFARRREQRLNHHFDCRVGITKHHQPAVSLSAACRHRQRCRSAPCATGNTGRPRARRRLQSQRDPSSTERHCAVTFRIAGRLDLCQSGGGVRRAEERWPPRGNPRGPLVGPRARRGASRLRRWGSCAKRTERHGALHRGESGGQKLNSPWLEAAADSRSGSTRATYPGKPLLRARARAGSEAESEGAEERWLGVREQ